MIAFLTDALQVIEQLTSGFDEGGLIDKATSEQKKKIFLATTNDAAKGALGGLCLYARKNFNWALHKYNALRMYKKNQTAEFMQKHSTPELMVYIRAEARRRDASKLEQKHKIALAAHAEMVVEKKKQKQQKKANKAAEEVRKIAAISWIEDISAIEGMTVVTLKLQLEKYRERVNGIPKKSEINKKRKPDLISLLKEVINQFNTSLVGNTNGEAQASAQGALLASNISSQEVAADISDVGTQQPIRIESVTWMKAKNTNKTQLKEQLQLYSTLVTDVPTSQEQQKMSKAQLSEALVVAFTKIQTITREQ